MKKGTVAVVLFAAVFFSAVRAFAADVDLEKDLQKELLRSRILIDNILEKIKTGDPIAGELEEFRGLTENIAASHLMLKERFSLRGETVGAFGNQEGTRHRVMEEGYLKALVEYLALVEGLQPSAFSSQLQTSQILQNLKTLLDKILHKKKTPILGNLPYRDLNYPAREPDGAPGLKPAYKGGNKIVSDDDLNDTPEAPITEETANLAQSLNWSPVLIYEYVKNEISTEWYWGCMKGAEETLRQKSGNDCDQATLLTALLRASGFPTRYVRGTMEFFAGGKDIVMEKVKNLIGVEEPLKIAEYFQQAGIPYRPVIEGGRIVNFQIEHIWVESQIPYSNYRGAIIDDQGKTWLGLDTSIKVKGYAYNSAADIYEQSGAGVLLSAIRDEYLSSVRTETPLEYFEERLSTLNLQLSTDSYKLTRTIIPEVMHILPASMQFDQKKITHEYTVIPEELKHKVRFVASDPKSSATGALFDITFNTMDLSNRMVALSSEPETVEDQEIIDSYGGLDNTPAYLVKLRPVLKVNGDLRSAGKDGLLMGEDFDLTIELISPNGTERVTNTQIAGNVSAIGIVSQRAVVGASGDTPSSEGESAENILYQEANRYIDRWNKAEEGFAGLLHLQMTRPLPTIVTVGEVLDVTYLLDMPHGVEWKGVYTDASFRAVQTVPAVQTAQSVDRQKAFMQLSALEGSALEHRILEDDLQVEAISTAKLMQIVGAIHESPSETMTIDKTNVTAALSASDLDDTIKEDITNAVNQNYLVRMPSANGLPLSAISYHDWTGTGYIKEDPLTGEAGYMLSGMIAGGMTVDAFNKWTDSKLAVTMSNPYSRTVTLIKITFPADRSVTRTPDIVVTGNVYVPNASVTVNNIEAEVTGTGFSAHLQLRPGMNLITASVVTNAGITLSDAVSVRYVVPLGLYITFPYDNAQLSVSPIMVEGLVSDPTAEVKVNGTLAAVSSDGRFMAEGTELSEGPNPITVTATNLLEETYTQTIAVSYNSSQNVSPIGLSISPIYGGIINRPSIMVKGTVATEAAEVWIKINGVLAEVYNGQFAANHVPLIEGDNRIIVNAIDSNGAVGRAEITVKANTAMPYIDLISNITSGIPTLTTYFSVNTEIPNPATNYQMDFDGDGAADYTGSSFDNMTYTYATEGMYYPTVTVTDDQGSTYTDTIAMTVLNMEKIGTLLKTKWEGMKEKLLTGNTEGALSFFTTRSKEKYGIIFSTFKDKLPMIFGTFVEFNITDLYETIAEFELVADEEGKLYSYPGVLIKDGNGIWKFKSF